MLCDAAPLKRKAKVGPVLGYQLGQLRRAREPGQRQDTQLCSLRRVAEQKHGGTSRKGLARLPAERFSIFFWSIVEPALLAIIVRCNA